jgi:serine/threonine protein kinase
MGVVYRARDPRLNRDVAIKILPEDVAGDADRILRFEREAQLLAQLNSPNIAAIYGVAESDGIRGLVLELVEGPTLADRLRGGALPVAEALAIAARLVDGLDAAHEKGIVHRDLKPANIKVTPDGAVKILDLGLAKSSGPLASALHSSSLTMDGTQAGTVLGTPAYMSPEQARGFPIDKRADIWAFGCVLYEMLTGRKAFGGETVSDAIAKIIGAEPDWSALPPATPVSIRLLLRRLLAKDPRTRVRDIGDVRFFLDDAQVSHQPRERQSDRRWKAVAAGAVLVTAATLVGVGSRSRPPTLLDLNDAVPSQLTSHDGTESFGALSPDGRSFAFVSSHGGSPDIWLRQVSGGEPVRLTNDPATESSLAFTRDGESLFFTRADGKEVAAWRIGALGGQARRVVGNARAAAPSPDGTRLAWFATEPDGSFTLFVSTIEGRDTRPLAKNVLAVVDVASAAWSPDGQRLAYTSGGLFAPRNLFVAGVDDGRIRQITTFTNSQQGPTSQAWLPDNRQIVMTFSAAPSMLSGGTDLGVVDTTTGAIRRLTSNVVDRFADPSVSADGTRLVVTSSRFEREVWRVPDGPDPVENGQAATRLLDAATDPMWIHVSRDGRTLLFNNAQIGSRNLWLMPLDGPGSPRQITAVPGDAVMHSALSPDGSHVAFVSAATGNSEIWVQHIDGSGLRQLTNDPAAESWPAWSPDGASIMFGSLSNGTWKTKVVPAGGGPAITVFDGFFRGDWIRKADAPGTWIVTANTDILTGGLRLLDGESHEEIWKIRQPGNGMPTFSPDARSVSIGYREARGRDAIWVYDVASGKSRVAARFPMPFPIAFRVGWVDDGRAFVVNRMQSLSHIAMFDRIGTPPS